MRSNWFRIGIVLSALAVISLLVIDYDIDIKIARFLVEPDNSWPGNQNLFWIKIYKLAPVPGLLLSLGSIVLFSVGYIFTKYKKNCRPSLFLILLVLLGPGFLVNVLGKGQLGRPRPNELTEFGGKYEFVQALHIGDAGENSSFPSGHAAIAFYLVAPWFIYRNKKRKKALLFLVSGVAFGMLVGFGRMLQGGHYLSDVIWAGGIVYLTGEILSGILLHHENNEKQNVF